MKIDGVNFNEVHFGKVTEAEFLKEMEGEGYAHIYEGPDRVNKLKEAYKIIKQKNQPATTGGK